MKNKKILSEELRRMKQLSGLINENTENDSFEEETRRCDECNNQMDQGFVVNGGEEYYCDEECLHKHYTPEEWAEMYGDGNSDSYWTQWEEGEDLNESTIDGGLTFDELPEKVKEYFKRNITVSVAFVKKDGSVRHMAFRRNLNAYIKSDKPKSELQMNVDQNNNFLSVYDTNAFIKAKKETGDSAAAASKSFRKVTLHNVLAFMAGGQVFDMRDMNKIMDRFGEVIYDSLTKNMISNLKTDEVSAESELGDDSSNKIDENVARKIIKDILKEKF